MSVPPAGSGGIQSYILRLWPEGPPEARAWRVTLTPIAGGERLGFPDLESAFRFLKELTEGLDLSDVQQLLGPAPRDESPG